MCIVKSREKICISKLKKVKVETLMLDKIGFKKRNITKNKNGYFIMT